MNEDTFWQIISLLAWDHTGDDDKVLLPAVTALSTYSEQDISRFEDILAETLYRIDGVSFARNIGTYSFKSDEEFFSVDEFLYVRCCAVANGRKLYERILSDPSQCPKIWTLSRCFTWQRRLTNSRPAEKSFLTKHP